MTSAPPFDHRPEPLAVDGLGDHGRAVADRREMHSIGTLASDSRDTKLCRSSRGCLYSCGSGLVDQAKHDDAGVTAWRVGADVTEPAVQGDQDPSRLGSCGDDVPVRCADQALLSDGVESWPTLVKMAADETGRFSSSLNFTVTVAAGATLCAPVRRRRRQPRARPTR